MQKSYYGIIWRKTRFWYVQFFRFDTYFDTILNTEWVNSLWFRLVYSSGCLGQTKIYSIGAKSVPFSASCNTCSRMFLFRNNCELFFNPKLFHSFNDYFSFRLFYRRSAWIPLCRIWNYKTIRIFDVLFALLLCSFRLFFYVKIMNETFFSVCLTRIHETVNIFSSVNNFTLMTCYSYWKVNVWCVSIVKKGSKIRYHVRWIRFSLMRGMFSKILCFTCCVLSSSNIPVGTRESHEILKISHNLNFGLSWHVLFDDVHFVMIITQE